MQPELDRGHLQRIRIARLGEREVALLEVRVPGETLHVVGAAGLGVGLLDEVGHRQLRETMKGLPAAPAQAFWRSRFEGARVRASQKGLEIAREGRSVVADFGRGVAVTLAEGALPEGATEGRAALEERGHGLVEALARAGDGDRRELLRKALGKAIARVARRVTAVEGDLARTETADDLARRAQLFVVAAASAPRGAQKLEAVDWSSGKAQTIALALDPARGAREQIDGLFKRARRLKEGARIARERLAEARKAQAGLEAALAALGEAGANLEALEGRARAAAPRDFKAGPEAGGGRAKGGRPAPRVPYRTFAGASGAVILVGRGAADNDALTLHVGRPHDLWLHAKDRTGAHVIVPLEKNASCPPELFVEAAHLAAHFSDAREETVVDVQYTPRRYLRKPKGSPPGTVIVDREKVLVLRKDEGVLRRLLEGER